MRAIERNRVAKSKLFPYKSANWRTFLSLRLPDVR
jgi:hypothetical protein